MKESLTLQEQQLLHAMTVAILACPPAIALHHYFPVMEQIAAIEHYLAHSNPSRTLTDSFFCRSGALVKRNEVVAVMRILPLSGYQYRVRVSRSGHLPHAMQVTRDRTDQWLIRRQAAGGVITHDIFTGERLC